MADNEFLTGYLSGQNEGGKGGMFGGGGWEGLMGLIVIASLFGYGNFGNGRNGGGAATQADVNWGFQFNDLQGSLRGITNGISDATYALNNSITGGFHGVDRGLCDLSHQLSQCCCDNRAAIADLKFTISQEDCATRNLMQNNTRDIIDAQNSGTRAILDFLTQDKIATLTAENQSLKFQASQANQNAFITANQEAQTAELIRRIAPVPVPSYTVPAPYPYGYGGIGCGCGCGC